VTRSICPSPLQQPPPVCDLEHNHAVLVYIVSPDNAVGAQFPGLSCSNSIVGAIVSKFCVRNSSRCASMSDMISVLLYIMLALAVRSVC